MFNILSCFWTKYYILASARSFFFLITFAKKNTSSVVGSSILVLFGLFLVLKTFKLWVQKLINLNKVSSTSGGGLELFLLPESPLVRVLSASRDQVFPTECTDVSYHWSPALNFRQFGWVLTPWLARFFLLGPGFLWPP